VMTAPVEAKTSRVVNSEYPFILDGSSQGLYTLMNKRY
jgi:hypothetical protein